MIPRSFCGSSPFAIASSYASFARSRIRASVARELCSVSLHRAALERHVDSFGRLTRQALEKKLVPKKKKLPEVFQALRAGDVARVESMFPKHVEESVWKLDIEPSVKRLQARRERTHQSDWTLFFGAVLVGTAFFAASH